MQTMLVAIAAALALSGGAANRQATEGFPDVPKNHWAYAAVTDLKARGILIGYPPETPAPSMRSDTGGKTQHKPARRSPRIRRRERK